MTVVNGQLANQTTFNNAFMSRTAATTSTVAKVTLANTDVESGANVVNTQKAINKIYEGVGTTGESDTDINNYSSENYIADGDSRKTAIEKLDVGLQATQDDLDNHKVAVDAHPQYLTEDEADLIYDPLGAAAAVDAALDAHVADLANPHAVTKTQVGLANVTNDAQLKRAAGDFNTFTEKVVGVADDILLLEDSADSYNKKKIKMSQVLGGGSGGINFITNGGAEAGTTGWATFNGVLTASAFASTDVASVAGGHNIPSGIYDIQVKILSVSTPCGLTVGATYYAAYSSATFLLFTLTPAGSAVDITADATITFSEIRPRVVAGTANVTIAANATNPLVGNNSFLLTKDAANRQYQGVAYDFTIDRAYQAQSLDIEMDYIVNSGTFNASNGTTDSDVIVYIYDVTNQKIIEPTSFRFLASNSIVSDKFTGTFQTPYNSTSYRLIMLVATTSTSAWSFKFDDVKVSPSRYPHMTTISDWEANDSIFSSSSGTVTNFQMSSIKRRVGSNLEIRFFMYFTGSPGTWGEPTISLGTGLTIDTSKVLGVNEAAPLGAATFLDAGSTFFEGSVVYRNTTSVRILPYAVSTHTGTAPVGAYSSFTNAFPVTVVSGDAFTGYFSVPILGWSSSLQTSDKADTRVVGLTARKAASQSIPSGGGGAVITNWPAGYTDSHGSFDATTGIYTVRSACRLRVYGMLAWASASGGIRVVDLIKGASTPLNSHFISASGTSSYNHEVNYEGDFVAGDTIKLNAFQNSGSALNIENLTTAGGSARLHISSVSNNQTIAAIETIVEAHQSSAAQTVNTSSTVLNFNSKVESSHGMWSGTEFTCGRTSKFLVTTSAVVGSGVALTLTIQKQPKGGSYVAAGYLYNGSRSASGSIFVRLNEGDKIRIVASLDSGSSSIDVTKEFTNLLIASLGI